MKKSIIFLIFSIIGILAIIINWLYAKATFTKTDVTGFFNPLAKMAIRNDVQGSGGFWKSRIGRYHEGVDYLCAKNEAVFAPIAGKITRKAYPYPTDLKYEGCVIVDESTKTEIKLFYMISDKIGKVVQKGEVIGKCQAINEKYGSTMKNHLHVEISVNNELINPENIFTTV